MLEHAFNVSLPVIPNKTTNLFSEITFDDEGNTFAVEHISIFFNKCLRHNISDPNVTCRLFTLTFRGQVKYVNVLNLHRIDLARKYYTHL
jgi:hypothetical protein